MGKDGVMWNFNSHSKRTPMDKNVMFVVRICENLLCKLTIIYIV